MKDHRFAIGKDGISLRWTARILSIVASGVFLFILFLVATNEDPPEGPGIVLVALLAASIVGCIAAWRWEKIGGAMVVICAIAVSAAAFMASVSYGLGAWGILSAIIYGVPFLVVGGMFWLSGTSAGRSVAK